MRYVVLFLVAFVVIAGLFYWFAFTNTQQTVATDTPHVALATYPSELVGTLTYYPDNLGTEVPYIVYKNGSSVATKALVFDETSSCRARSGTYPCPLVSDAIRQYFGAGPVEIVGVITDADIFVESLSITSS